MSRRKNLLEFKIQLAFVSEGSVTQIIVAIGKHHLVAHDAAAQRMSDSESLTRYWPSLPPHSSFSWCHKRFGNMAAISSETIKPSVTSTGTPISQACHGPVR